jgi:hypothetical protein
MKLGIGTPGMGQRARTRRGSPVRAAIARELAHIVARTRGEWPGNGMDTGVAPIMRGSRKPLGVVRLLEGSNPSLSAEQAGIPHL